MKNIFLVRHGQSLANVDRFAAKGVLPDHAIPLTELGQQQADAAGPALVQIMQREHIHLSGYSNIRMWTSPYLRTRDTAQRIHQSLKPIFPKLDLKEHINLAEQQFGLFDNVPDEDLPKVFPLEHSHYDLAEKFNGRFWARMPLGESRFDVAVRVHQAFGTFIRDEDKHGIDNLIVVCHGVTMRAFIMQWLNLPYEWMDEQRNPGNCDIYHIGQKMHGYVYKNGEIL